MIPSLVLQNSIEDDRGLGFETVVRPWENIEHGLKLQLVLTAVRVVCVHTSAFQSTKRRKRCVVSQRQGFQGLTG